MLKQVKNAASINVLRYACLARVVDDDYCIPELILDSF